MIGACGPYYLGGSATADKDNFDTLTMMKIKDVLGDI
jgi:hypothetical protein